ncbi:MAG: SpoIIIAH-like family protein [Ruminococcus sp.]|nr:SpoIIIAH-like family protein [Ruminococcus sp.]
MKKPSFIIGKKQIILSCLTLMLAVAVYVNYAITTKSDSVTEPSETADLKGDVSYGDTEFVSAGTAQNPTEAASETDTAEETSDALSEETAAEESGSFELSAQEEGQSAEDYFAQARLERTASRDESVATLQSIMGGGDRTEDELITDAIAAVETSQLIESESNIESIVKSMGYTDCIVYLDTDSAKVVVQTEGLDSAQAAAIKDVILGEVTIPAENIRLFEVK